MTTEDKSRPSRVDSGALEGKLHGLLEELKKVNQPARAERGEFRLKIGLLAVTGLGYGYLAVCIISTQLTWPQLTGLLGLGLLWLCVVFAGIVGRPKNVW